MSATTEGLTIEFYPARLTEEDLSGMEILADFLLPAAGLGAPLGDWLGEVAARERRRRLSGEAIEVESPSLPVQHWTDAKVGSALMASQMMEHTAAGRALADMAHRIHTTLCVIAQDRLTRNSAD